MLKHFFERWFRIKNKKEAMEIRRKFSLLYAFIGWNSFIVIFYIIMKKEIPEDPNERSKCRFCRLVISNFVNNGTYLFFAGAAYRSLIPTPSTKMHVYQISGLTLTNEFEVAYNAKVAQVEKENKENANAKTDEN